MRRRTPGCLYQEKCHKNAAQFEHAFGEGRRERCVADRLNPQNDIDWNVIPCLYTVSCSSIIRNSRVTSVGLCRALSIPTDKAFDPLMGI